MYLGEPVTRAAAAAMRRYEVLSLPGVPIATAHEAGLPAAASVVFAVYGTALDVSELEGLPPGSVLLLDGARSYQVTDGPGEAYPAAIRVTLRQHRARGVRRRGNQGGEVDSEGKTGQEPDKPPIWPPPLPSSDASLRLAPRPAQVGRSRRWTAHLLESWGLAEAVDSAVLVVSELVTNAIAATVAARDGGGAARSRELILYLHRDGETLVVEVSDQCAGTVPESRQSLPEDEGGRGLQVVAALCTQWGFRETPGGKVVWCELAAKP